LLLGRLERYYDQKDIYFPPARPASLGEAGEADQPLADIILFLSRHFIFYSWWAGSRFSGDII